MDERETKRYMPNDLVWTKMQGKIRYGTAGNCLTSLIQALQAGERFDLDVNDPDDLTWGRAGFEQGDDGVTNYERAGSIQILLYSDGSTDARLVTDDGTLVPNP